VQYEHPAQHEPFSPFLLLIALEDAVGVLDRHLAFLLVEFVSNVLAFYTKDFGTSLICDGVNGVDGVGCEGCEGCAY
jgi:hypothetical protein